ncbi:MAG: transcription antitermination factor NusB, partial [Eubacterium sp.]|nr:transcription antitermination factor NusB [Eubacterium sp.]
YSENVEEVCDYAKEISQGVSEHKSEFNELISKYLKSWKLSRLPKVSLAILYVAIYEMKYADSVPDNVAINEAVELAKKYSSKDDASFINGVLGAISRGE